MKLNKKAQSTNGLIGGIVAVFIVVLVLTVGVYGYKYVIDFAQNIDHGTQVSTPTDFPPLVNSVFWIILGQSSTNDWQTLILFLAVILIFASAFYDILSTFSSFNKTTAGLITTGLIVVLGVSGSLERIATWAGLTATYGAVTVGVLIIYSFVLAAVMGLFMGPLMIKFRIAKQKAQIAQEASDEAAKLAYGGKILKNFGQQMKKSP